MANPVPVKNKSFTNWLTTGVADTINRLRYNSKTINDKLIELNDNEITSFNNKQIYYRLINEDDTSSKINTYTFVPDTQKNTIVLKLSDGPKRDVIDHIIKKIKFGNNYYYLIFMKSKQSKPGEKTVTGENIYRLHYISFENNTDDYLF